MISSQFVIFNGKIYQYPDIPEGIVNRAFYYGDSLFETMHANGSRVQFFNDHIIRITAGMQTLKMVPHENFNLERIHQDIERVLHRNRLFKGARIRLTVFRNFGGYYSPATNTTSYLIETGELEHENYILNKKGLSIRVYEEVRKSLDILSNHKTGNSLIYVLAGIYKKEKGVDDCLIMNENGVINESISCNVFVVSGNEVYTPSLKEGCVDGVMRKQIIKLIENNDAFELIEKPLDEDDLYNADEIFLSNAIIGIRWVVAFLDRRYYCKLVVQLTEELNKLAFS